MTATLHDPAIPHLADALCPERAGAELERVCGGRLMAIRVTRHKPGRRCLIEYDLKRGGETVTVIGKARSKGADRTAYDVTRRLWAAADGFAVPEPIALVPALGLWLQRKVPGVPSTALLLGDGVELARRVAEALHALHRAGVLAPRRHTLADELAILERWLTALAEAQPYRAPRLGRVIDGCRRLAGTIPAGAGCGIHRDFYPDQVLADGPRLWLLDFDLYSAGDPALDAGNFLGHLTELAVRTHGDPDALADREAAFEARFAELSGRREAVRAYALLTLARHVALSTRFEERRPFADRLLELCEERLARAGCLRL